MTQIAPRPTARERLLASAAELFYAEGVHTVGIDRVIEHAGVAKASLYKSFGSKDELVRAYLERRHAVIEDHTTAVLERWDDPVEKILGVFTAQGERAVVGDYRGCAFVSATAESAPDSGAQHATEAYRTWLHGLFRDLVTRAGFADVEILVPQLVMIYDGAALSVRLDANRDAAATARRTASLVLDAATG